MSSCVVPGKTLFLVSTWFVLAVVCVWKRRINMVLHGLCGRS